MIMSYGVLLFIGLYWYMPHRPTDDTYKIRQLWSSSQTGWN